MKNLGTIGLPLFIVSSLAAATTVNYAKLPLAFERVEKGGDRYFARGNGYAVSLDGGSAQIRVADSNVSLRFEGSRKAAGAPAGELPGKVNYIYGNDPRGWRVGLPTYGRVAYQGIYPDIDLVYYGNQQQLEFDLVLHPGADLRRIRLKFSGAERLSVEEDGALTVHTASGDLRLPLPAIYQDLGGARRKIDGHYALRGNEVGFRLDRYDRSKALVIDPSIVWAGYIGGGTNVSEVLGVAVDAVGNTWLAGFTTASDFPLLNAAYSTMYGSRAGFVAKIDPTGSTLLFSTFIGGTGNTSLNSIAVDTTGAAWVAGTAGAYFPTTSGAYQTTTGTGIVFKVDPNGNLLYSTYLDGTTGSIAVDPTGNAYVTGTAGTGFTATAGAFQTTAPGGADGYVVKFSSAGVLEYATYLGGPADEIPYGVAVDSTGNAYLAGVTYSASFPGAPGGGAQPQNSGGGDIYIAKLNPSGTALAYFTFLGGSQYDTTKRIAVDSLGNAYVSGATGSRDFPVTQGVLQGTFGGGSADGFAAKLNPTGSAFVYVTYLGGNRAEVFRAQAIDSAGDLYVTGYSASNNYPILNPIQATQPADTNTIALFQTTNSGTLWTAFDTNIGGVVSSVLPDPVSEGTLLAVSDGGIYRTTNGGGAWTQTYFGDTNVPLNYGNGIVSRSLAASNTLYFLYYTLGLGGAADSTIVYRSTDGGVTWGAPVTLLPTTELYPGYIVADPGAAGTAYVTGNAATVYQTTDGGATWNTLNTGLPSVAVVNLVASPDGSIYMGTANATVYKSTNQGATWTSVSSGLSGTGVANGLTVSLSTPSVLYWSNGSNTIYTTANGGTNWTATAATLPAKANSVSVSPTNSALVFATTGGAVAYMSSNSGGTWSATTATNSGLGNLDLVVFDPLASGTLYALSPLGGQTVIVTEVNPTGTGLIYSTFLNSSSIGLGLSAATYGGDVIVAGYMGNLFPVTTTAWSGGGDTPNVGSTYGFVARVTNTPVSCTYAVTPAAETIYSGAQSLTFDISAPSGCAWTASGQDFATIEAGAPGNGSGYVLVGVSSNGTGQNRSATLTIAGQPVTLTQAPSSCGYSLNQSSFSLGAAGGPVQVNLTTGGSCPWTVVNIYPFAVTLNSAASGTGNATISLSVGATAAQGSRSLRFPIGSSTLTVTQAGYCTYSLSSAKTSFVPEGGTGSVAVTAPANCAWTATSNQTWLTVTSGTGDGSGSLGFSAAANTGIPRSAAITVAGQSFAVSQVGAYVISTLAGGQLPAAAMAGIQAPLGIPQSAAVDAGGNVYFSSAAPPGVFRLDTSGTLTRVAGTGVPGYSGDSGPAIGAQLNNPGGVAVDSHGNVYIADATNNRIRKVDTAGTITTVVGNGTPGFAGDNGPAITAELSSPQQVALDSQGNLYIADTGNFRIRAVVNGNIATIAGNGTSGYTGDNNPATSAEIGSVFGLAVDGSGNVYLSDQSNSVVREVSGGIIWTVAGNGTPGYSGDTGPATGAELVFPGGIGVDGSGNLYIADSENNRIREVSNGVITTVAGNGKLGFAGDGGPAASASLNQPTALAVDSAGDLYIGDYSDRIREVSHGVITTIAGAATGDGGPAPFSAINWPLDVRLDGSGNVYLADGYENRIRKISPNGEIATVAGTGVSGFAGDSGPATAAQLSEPADVAFDGHGNMYIADTLNHRVRMVSASGTISTVAGNGSNGYSGDSGPATSASLNSPMNLAFDAAGNLYIDDYGAQVIRKVSNGTITTVAGTGTAGYSGDNGPATSAELKQPRYIAVDSSGNLYIVDVHNRRVREVSNGIISTVAGNGMNGFSGDGGLAISASLGPVQSVAVDAVGNLFIGDGTGRVRVVALNGIISTIAGNGSSPPTGDGGPATSAGISLPIGVAVDSSGNVYVADIVNYVLRLITPAGGPPVLAVASAHTGSFTPGQSAQYTLTVSNAALAGATNGTTVTVTDIVPASMTITNMTGTNWTCSGNSCTRTDALAGGSSYDAIDVTVSVAAPAPIQLTNQVTVAGGGAAMTGTEDLTPIAGAVPTEPAVSGPADGSTADTLSVTLSWSDGLGVQTTGGPTTYNVYFGTTSPPPLLATTGGTTYSVTGLTPGATYYWQIQANNGVHTDSSEIRSFNTASGTNGAACEVTADSQPAVADIQQMINEALGVAAPANDLTGDGAVNLVDVQRVANSVLKLGCTLM